MQKQAPTLPRILAMAVFALSCFGLLLFLWLSFGGPTPLKPKGYRFDVALAEAPQLGLEADVRVAGIEVGKVRAKRVDPRGNRTVATIELEPRYAPISRDARATLRTKGILGETYVELTLGDRDAPAIPEGGRLPDRNVEPAVELDELLSTFDPITRQAFRTWQQSLAQALRGRGRDLNDALGNLPGFVDAGGDLLEVLDRRRAALRGLVRNGGVVFEALSRNESQLRTLIESSDTVLSAIAREREAFADLWQVFPTFLDESRASYARLERFARDTRPLVRELTPAIEDLGPTLESLGDLGPHLRRLFRNMDPLITASRRSLPATREILDGLRPLLGALGPWLQELNPILGWLGEHQHTITDMFANLGGSTAARTESAVPGAPGHYLRQFGPTGAETVAMHPNRLSSNRGNAYLNPMALVGPAFARNQIAPAFDCRNAGGEKDQRSGVPPSPACHEQKPHTFQGQAKRFTQVTPRDYSR